MDLFVLITSLGNPANTQKGRSMPRRKPPTRGAKKVSAVPMFELMHIFHFNRVRNSKHKKTKYSMLNRYLRFTFVSNWNIESFFQGQRRSRKESVSEESSEEEDVVLAEFDKQQLMMVTRLHFYIVLFVVIIVM